MISPSELCVILRDRMNLLLQTIDFGTMEPVENIDRIRTEIVPGKISKERDMQNRTKIKTLQAVKIVFLGAVEEEADPYRWLTAVAEMMDQFLIDGGILYKDHKIPCMAVETLSGAEAGYDEQSLKETPALFMGGFQATFWVS